MTLDEAIAASGTLHMRAQYWRRQCLACESDVYPCREALRAAAEYALRDAEAWKRVAVRQVERLGPVGITTEAAEAVATESHRLVLTQIGDLK